MYLLIIQLHFIKDKFINEKLNFKIDASQTFNPTQILEHGTNIRYSIDAKSRQTSKQLVMIDHLLTIRFCVLTYKEISL